MVIAVTTTTTTHGTGELAIHCSLLLSPQFLPRLPPPASRLPQSTKKVPLEKWMTYAGERSGRFEGMKAKDGSSKTECGIHSFDANAK